MFPVRNSAFQETFPPRLTSTSAATESGVDDSVTSKFPGSEVKVGSAASGAGDNREIPLDEGGELDRSGRYVSPLPRVVQMCVRAEVESSPTKARDFEGEGGPEEKRKIYEEENPGNDDVQGNVRQGGETRRA